ncbi:MAG TPA: hypothetical protein VGM67_07635 [Gemmatimonadaceae bacterium]|jgi:hypothetical protein
MSGTDSAEKEEKQERQQYGTIVVVGGGCYGSYYVRQLHRAAAASALDTREIVVVDRDANCQVARDLEANVYAANTAPPTRVIVADWRDYFEQYLTGAAAEPDAHKRDAIVPSPLMPHLMAEWLVRRVRDRWPEREVVTQAFDNPPDAPWSRAGDDGVHYVSFATWMCPINCIEPRICPHTRDTRTWSMPTHLAAYGQVESDAGRHTVMAVLHCRHRAYGVGMFDTAEVTGADAQIHVAATRGAASVVIGTVSHCHGALTRLEIAAPVDSGVPTDSHDR